MLHPAFAQCRDIGLPSQQHHHHQQQQQKEQQQQQQQQGCGSIPADVVAAAADVVAVAAVAAAAAVAAVAMGLLHTRCIPANYRQTDGLSFD